MVNSHTLMKVNHNPVTCQGGNGQCHQVISSCTDTVTAKLTLALECLAPGGKHGRNTVTKSHTKVLSSSQPACIVHSYARLFFYHRHVV